MVKTKQKLLSIFELIFIHIWELFKKNCLANFYICGRFVFTFVGLSGGTVSATVGMLGGCYPCFVSIFTPILELNSIF